MKTELSDEQLRELLPAYHRAVYAMAQCWDALRDMEAITGDLDGMIDGISFVAAGSKAPADLEDITANLDVESLRAFLDDCTEDGE